VYSSNGRNLVTGLVAWGCAADLVLECVLAKDALAQRRVLEMVLVVQIVFVAREQKLRPEDVNTEQKWLAQHSEEEAVVVARSNSVNYLVPGLHVSTEVLVSLVEVRPFLPWTFFVTPVARGLQMPSFGLGESKNQESEKRLGL
jgi:hypothetical protein